MKLRVRHALVGREPSQAFHNSEGPGLPTQASFWLDSHHKRDLVPDLPKLRNFLYGERKRGRSLYPNDVSAPSLSFVLIRGRVRRS